jgi:hypothetical protein
LERKTAAGVITPHRFAPQNRQEGLESKDGSHGSGRNEQEKAGKKILNHYIYNPR